MPKYEPKTRENDADVDAFIDSLEDERQREDSRLLKELYEKITKHPAKMWGGAIIGFGSMPYTNSLGTNNWPQAAFSPRKGNLTVYIGEGFEPYEDHLKKLGKHKIGKSCLYIKRLSDVDLKVLKEMIQQSAKKWRQEKATKAGISSP